MLFVWPEDVLLSFTIIIWPMYWKIFSLSKMEATLRGNVGFGMSDDDQVGAMMLGRLTVLVPFKRLKSNKKCITIFMKR